MAIIMRILLSLNIWAVIVLPVYGQVPQGDWTYLLQKYVSIPDSTTGLTRFDYARLQATPADMARLNGYIARYEDVTLEALDKPTALAFGANLYNAVTVRYVAEQYPISSIRHLGVFKTGPWRKPLFRLNGQAMSLGELEHRVLRAKFSSPYLHYMLNCASVGCPNLLASAWEAETVEAESRAAAKAFINSPRGVQITPEGLRLSKIFKWYREDFGADADLRAHLRRHGTPDLIAAIDAGVKIIDYDYDWSLNNKIVTETER